MNNNIVYKAEITKDLAYKKFSIEDAFDTSDANIVMKLKLDYACKTVIIIVLDNNFKSKLIKYSYILFDSNA